MARINEALIYLVLVAFTAINQGKAVNQSSRVRYARA
jgi:hypothetical protein